MMDYFGLGGSRLVEEINIFVCVIWGQANDGQERAGVVVDLFAQASADLAPPYQREGNYEMRNKEARMTTAIHPLPKGRETGELIRVEHWPYCSIGQ
jgi:hypothetical protein